MMTRRRFRRGALWTCASLWVLTGCADTSQASARDRAMRETCDKYEACEQIGPGRRYESREACEIQERATWNNAWPAADCDGRINLEQLQVCLDTIRASECGNGFDLLNIVFNKCPKTKICDAN